jgi:hypothetical protein
VLPAYAQAAQFHGEKPAGRIYDKLQDTIFHDPGCDLSVFRLILERHWHVAVIGEPPRPDLRQRIEALLARGIPTSLPDDLLRELQRRRTQSIKLGPWVERHLRDFP